MKHSGLEYLLVALASLAPLSDAFAQPRSRIDIPAASFTRSENVAAGAKACGEGAYGTGVILNVPPCRHARNVVEYQFIADAAGRYRFYAEYAAAESRPVMITLNGVVLGETMGVVTGCWYERCQQWHPVGAATVELRAGVNTMRVERDSYFPHIRAFRFEPAAGDDVGRLVVQNVLYTGESATFYVDGVHLCSKVDSQTCNLDTTLGFHDVKATVGGETYNARVCIVERYGMGNWGKCELGDDDNGDRGLWCAEDGC